MFKIVLLLISALLLSGCSSAIHVKIDAINIPNYSTEQQTYKLLSGNPDISSNDLYFKEFSRFANHALKTTGLELATDDKKASQKIFFSFGINNGTTERYSYTIPVYEQIGGESITIEERTVTNGNLDTSTKEIYIPYSHQIVGREQRIHKITTYQSYLRLEGRSNSEESEQLWMITIEASSSSDDLRMLIPIMLSNAQPFIGNNSGKIINIKIQPNDAKTQQFIDQVNQ